MSGFKRRQVKIIKIIAAVMIIALGIPTGVVAQAVPVRLKDIGKIIEARENQLFGFGLVVGLRNTGDSRNTVFTQTALANLLGKMGVSSGGQAFNSRNTAAVMVTATLPPFMKPGQRISIQASALGDCTSLVGGTLLLTPLQGPDMQTYAVAQGSLIVGGVSEQAGGSGYYKNQSTVARVPNGAIIEREVPVTFMDQHNITIVLNDPNFITISRAVKAIQRNGFPGAKAIDANTIKIPLADLDSSDLVTTIAGIENISLIPDGSSKVVVNAKTGTIVIGDRVRLFPVAVTHGSISVTVLQDEALANAALIPGTIPPRPLQVDESGKELVYLNPTATLSSLVNALNSIGVSPKDLISILQALKASGSLVASLEVI